MTRVRLVILSIVLSAPLAGCAKLGRNIVPLHDPPPPHWSQRVEKAGLEDVAVFRRCDQLYHGAQPTPEEFQALKRQLGIRTVVNVRRTHSDEKVVETLGMKYISIPIAPWSLKEEHTVEFLKVMRDPDHWPVYVYCWYGGDRSNTLAAMYRVAAQGWCKDEAIREMTEGGNYFHFVWQNQVGSVRRLDVERVRRQIGLDQPIADRCPCGK